MSTATVYGSAPPLLTPPTSYITNLGIGYAIAISLGFLVIFSAIILIYYFCCRFSRNQNPTNSSTSSDNGVILPRIVFVAEDDDNENVVVGLDQAVINSYPKFTFSKGRGSGGSDCGNDSVCPICLCEYKDAEMMRILPDCKHYFHLTCIDAWLKLNASCPVCRNSPLPTPLSTPLSEVVPLSQYSDGRRRR